MTEPALPIVAWLMDTDDDASWAEVDECLGRPPEAECPSIKRVVPLVTLESANAHAAACVAAERERCAKLAESDEFYGNAVQHAIAAAIRKGTP